MAQPMPMFFRAPPKPESSWPLKWLTTMRRVGLQDLPRNVHLVKYLSSCIATVAPLELLIPSAITMGQPTTA